MTTTRQRLEALREQYERTDGDYRATIRQRARALCRYAGLPCPAWCADRRRGPDVHIEVPTDIPPALSAWRQRTRGAMVRINARGVELYALGCETRHYATVQDAVEAVT